MGMLEGAYGYARSSVCVCRHRHPQNEGICYINAGGGICVCRHRHMLTVA